MADTPVSQPEVVAHPPAPAQAYFKKFKPSTGFYVDGKKVEFGGDASLGLLQLDVSNPLVPALRAASQESRGGIVEITAEAYDSLKKKVLSSNSAPTSRRLVPRFARGPLLRVEPTTLNGRPRLPGARAAVGERADANSRTEVMVRSRFPRRPAGVESAAGGGGPAKGSGNPEAGPASSGSPFVPSLGPKSYKPAVIQKAVTNSFAGAVPVAD